MAQIACPCPALPGGEPRHEHDEVTLRPKLTPRDAMAISKDVAWLRTFDEDATTGDVLAVLTEGYVLRGVESWTLVDADGKPLEVTKANIRERLLSDLETATIVGDEADGLYAEAVMLPLLRMASTSSPPTPTPSEPAEDSTSAPMDSGTTLPTPSTPSSTTTSPTDDTETMSSSLVGVSSFSPSSASAA